jgi:hypothetical protein
MQEMKAHAPPQKIKEPHTFARVRAFLIVIALVLSAFYGSTHSIASGDTWVALACGRHIMNHGLDTRDPFSENSFRPGPTAGEIASWPAWARWCAEKAGPAAVASWHPTGVVNNIWLSHVIFYWLACRSPFSRGGCSYEALVWLKFMLCLLTVLCLYGTGRVRGASPLLSALFTCLCVFVSRPFWDIRPAAFSVLFIAAFLLILALATQRKILYIWLMVPLVALWCNLHSGFCFILMALPLYVASSLAAPHLKGLARVTGAPGLWHIAAAGALASIASVLLSPFRLSNITSTSLVTLGPAAREWYDVFEWRPAFERGPQFGDTAPFLALCIITMLIVATFFVISILARKSREKAHGGSGVMQPVGMQLDIGSMSIMILAFSMAVAHRRLVPVAAITACPLLAALCHETILAGSFLWSSRAAGLRPSAFKSIQREKLFTLAAAFFIVALGGWWAYRFKEAYSAPLPADETHTSLFMRMTVSYTKPFQACRFIRDNLLDGFMLNYWTDGGFISWEELPDPVSGRIPLQLFVDQRAHRAFDYRVRGSWKEIMKGGPPGIRALSGGHGLLPGDCDEIGRWLGGELRKRSIGVVLMPAYCAGEPLVRGLESTREWQLVYLDRFYLLYVDTSMARGKELFLGITSGKTRYPDEFSRDLALAHLELKEGSDAGASRRALDHAMKAQALLPSEISMDTIIATAQCPELYADIERVCSAYLEEFCTHRQALSEKSGYLHPLQAAMKACIFLQDRAAMREDKERKAYYAGRCEELEQERARVTKRSQW